MTEGKPPFPPFDREAALRKVRAAEDAWNSRDADRVAMAYSVDSHWRNRAEVFEGREAVLIFFPHHGLAGECPHLSQALAGKVPLYFVRYKSLYRYHLWADRNRRIRELLWVVQDSIFRNCLGVKLRK